MHKPVLIYLVAGEASGDQIGALLIKALKEKTEGNIRLAGVGGALMKEQGLDSLFPMSELSIMGLIEILPHIPNILRRLSQTIKDIHTVKPDLVVTIDSPGFNFRLAKKLRKSGIPVVHYTAPTVWAWRQGRVTKMIPLFKHVLALFPFEPPYFEKEGLPCTFVGHPLVEKKLDQADGKAFRERYHIPEDQIVLCLLPGSREREITTLFPLFMEAVKILRFLFPNLMCVIPTSVEKGILIQQLMLQQNFENGLRVVLVTDEHQKFQAMKASQGALAASGTVTLELSLVGTPMVVAYKINKLTAWILRRLILIPYVSLPNIIKGAKIVPELLQGACQSSRLAEEMTKILKEDSQEATLQTQAFANIQKQLKGPGESPSETAADILLGLIG